MDTIWQIRLEPETDEIVLEEFQVVGETAKMYLYDRKDEKALQHGRIAKIAVDKDPGLLGGGKWYSTPEKAFMAWQQHNQQEMEFHQGIVEKCTKAIKVRAWE